MERIGLGFKILKENLWLWFVALGLNFLIYIIEVMTNTLPLVPPGFYLKFAMPNNIPEMSSILQQPHTQGIHFNFSFAIAVMSLYTNLVDEPTNLKSTLHEDSL